MRRKGGRDASALKYLLNTEGGAKLVTSYVNRTQRLHRIYGGTVLEKERGKGGRAGGT